MTDEEIDALLAPLCNSVGVICITMHRVGDDFRVVSNVLDANMIPKILRQAADDFENEGDAYRG